MDTNTTRRLPLAPPEIQRLVRGEMVSFPHWATLSPEPDDEDDVDYAGEPVQDSQSSSPAARN